MIKLFKRLVSVICGLTMAFGVGLAVARNAKSPIQTMADYTYTRVDSLSDIDESSTYVLGLVGTGTGKGFHYSGTSSWGLIAQPSAQLSLEYKMTKSGSTFKASTKIGNDTYYLQVPSKGNFSMITNSNGANTNLCLGTTSSVKTGEIATSAVSVSGYTARMLRINSTSGLRSYEATTGDLAYFYKRTGTAPAVDLSSITVADIPTLHPAQTHQVVITFDPTNASNQSVSYQIIEGSDVVSVSGSGLLTVLKTGNAQLRVTPSDTHANPVVKNISVTDYDSPVGVSIGDRFALVASTKIEDVTTKFELTEISGNSGTGTIYSTDPAFSFVCEIENGFYTNTIALTNDDKYLALTSNNANLNYISNPGENSSSYENFKKQASWLVNYDSSTGVALVKNIAFQTRYIGFNYTNGIGKFACYTNPTTYPLSFVPVPEVKVTDFSIQSVMNIQPTYTRQMKLTYTPDYATDAVFSWRSSDNEVATVDSNGLVTGVAPGTATIYCEKTISSALVSRSCTVSVANFHEGTAADPYSVADVITILDHPSDFTETFKGTRYITGIYNRTETAWSEANSNISIWIKDSASAVEEFELYRMGAIVEPSLVANTTIVTVRGAASNFTIYKSTTYEVTTPTYIDPDEPVVTEFVSTYMHMGDTAFESEDYINVCDKEDKDGNTPYSLAKAAYNALTTRQKDIFLKGSSFANAKARLLAWATANHDELNETTHVLESNHIEILSPNSFAQNNSLTMIIVIVSLVSISSIGGYFFLRRKEQ